jgi:competence CoiA-like predicted nuclease
MKIVIDSQGEWISIDDLALGMLHSEEYFCPDCQEPVIYVSRSDRAGAHFRHQVESHCSYDGDRTCKMYLNKKSDFHLTWQGLFPKKCLEVVIGSNRVDIYLTSSDNNLVIEVQHSPISRQDLIKRENQYPNLWWIFDLQNSKFTIEHLRTYVEDTYRLKFFKGDSSFMQLLHCSSKAKIFLDNGGTNLY